jgi:hypothetical protein
MAQHLVEANGAKLVDIVYVPGQAMQGQISNQSSFQGFHVVNFD